MTREDEIRAWTAANKRAAEEYASAPFEHSTPTMCCEPGCYGEREPGKNRCPHHHYVLRVTKRWRRRKEQP